MSTTFLEAIEQVIGKDGDEFGFRYAVNHDSDSESSTAGESAIYPLTFNSKMEADPSLMSSQDLSADFPAVYFNPIGNYPDMVTRGNHSEATFTVAIYIVTAQVAGATPRQTGREWAVKVLENIMALDKLNLDWVDVVEPRGVLDDPFTQQLHLLLPRLCAGGLMFNVKASGIVW